MGWQQDTVILEKCKTNELQAVETLKSDTSKQTKKIDQCDLLNADLSPHPKTIVHVLQVTFVEITLLMGCK